MSDIISVRRGAYSGCYYLVVAGEWYPLSEEYWKRGTIFDYDADLGTYINGVLGYGIQHIDMNIDDYLRECYNSGKPISLNRAAREVLEMMEVNQ